ncbi:NAD(P)/FAD-dependent oxidoreductase [Mesorhizobium kowhaii]|uniref:Pyridine nucleotide-disulfide oxidoreductase n=1 Tax=Mesorhizobium kowhaii TaxID=1300272 RepID=A0A2W7C7F6_9HYPH|nr:FAD-dependent oxidoreductase [Mesorhizobium kowhaii]PZV38824.1 pyridine nucleotide-disulfide oxidoreductase [Mesorhizobium kowhaii]
MNMLADVIVIGGGPSGVAAALELRRQGVEKVIILEREPYLGGATRHCSHSPFGMLEFGRVYFGESYGRKLEDEAAKAGVEVRTGYSVVDLEDDGTLRVTSPHGVEEMRASRILYATGAREKPRSARLITGDRPIGVVTTGTLQSYVAFHGLMPFRKPVIVGSELVALSATLTCLMHGARPVAVLEPRPHALARAPLTWFPTLVGIPFHRGTELVDIKGRTRVEAVTIRKNGSEQTLECDGVLLTGQFTPESSLFLKSTMGIDRGSDGPKVDQSGRTVNPIFFAAGNVLRAVETGGWAFCEGRAVGKSLASDLQSGIKASDHVPVTHDDPIKLVMPSILRRADTTSAAFNQFQLRVTRRVKGRLSLEIDGKEVWSSRKVWMPERRILVPIPPQALSAQAVGFRIVED